MTVEHVVWVAAAAIGLIGVRWLVERVGLAVVTWHKVRNPPDAPSPASDSTDPDA